MTTWLIAPPGTRIGEPGWFRPPRRLTLAWGIDGTMPPYAVQRNGVLLCTGVAPDYPAWSILPKCLLSRRDDGEHEWPFYDPGLGVCGWCGQAARRCPECLTLAGLHHDPGCTQPCEACHDARNHTRWHRG